MCEIRINRVRNGHVSFGHAHEILRDLRKELVPESRLVFFFFPPAVDVNLIKHVSSLY